MLLICYDGFFGGYYNAIGKSGCFFEDVTMPMVNLDVFLLLRILHRW